MSKDIKSNWQAMHHESFGVYMSKQEQEHWEGLEIKPACHQRSLVMDDIVDSSKFLHIKGKINLIRATWASTTAKQFSTYYQHDY